MDLIYVNIRGPLGLIFQELFKIMKAKISTAFDDNHF